jgi:hypothetical protein
MRWPKTNCASVLARHLQFNGQTPPTTHNTISFIQCEAEAGAGLQSDGRYRKTNPQHVVVIDVVGVGVVADDDDVVGCVCIVLLLL